MPKTLKGTVIQQLQAQGRKQVSSYRFAVELEIAEASARPAKDLDNYAKPIIDAITQSKLLWKDDTQIDRLIISRRRDGNAVDTNVRVVLSHISGQHRGVPTYFRARCSESRRGRPNGYIDAGYHLALHLGSELPYDLEESDWLKEITHLKNMIAADDKNNSWIWFHDHLPKFMELVPNPRKEQFLLGVWKAYEEERL